MLEQTRRLEEQRLEQERLRLEEQNREFQRLQELRNQEFLRQQQEFHHNFFLVIKVTIRKINLKFKNLLKLSVIMPVMSIR